MKGYPYNMKYTKKSLGNFLLVISILMTVIIQFLIGTSLYPIIRLFIYVLFAVTFFVNIPRISISKSKFLNIYFVIVFFTLIHSLIIKIINNEISIDPFVQVTLPLFLVLLGNKNTLSKQGMSKLLLYYLISVTFLGLFVIFKYGDGFQISGVYFFDSKNQVGPFIASVAMITMLSLFNNSMRSYLNINKSVVLVIFIINILSLLVLRNRAGILALFVCLFILWVSKVRFFKEIKKRTIINYIITIFLIILIIQLGILNPFFEMVYNSFFLNYSMEDLNSLSANRTDIYLSVLHFLKISPFFGELMMSSFIQGTPHNYILNLWLKYGIIGMLPATTFYFFLWFFALYRILRKEFNISNYLLLFMLVLSLFEPTYPFAPLTTVSLTWFLLGNSLRQNSGLKKS